MSANEHLTMAYREDLVDIEMQSGSVHRSFTGRTIGRGDVMENRFGVRLFRDGVPMVLDGSVCDGYFMAPSGQNIFISGDDYTSVHDNIAWVQLPGSCYNTEGQFTLAIRIISEDESIVGTLRIVDGIISNTSIEGAIDPPEDVPTWEQIIAAYNQMVAAKEGAVRFDIRQDTSLSDTEKARARTNINALDKDVFDALGLYVDSSGYVCQTLASDT